jgi:6-phosphofructokinase
MLERRRCIDLDRSFFLPAGGPIGLVKGDFIVIDAPLVAKYRNQGGFDIIGAVALHHSQFDQKKLLAESLSLCVRCGVRCASIRYGQGQDRNGKAATGLSRGV